MDFRHRLERQTRKSGQREKRGSQKGIYGREKQQNAMEKGISGTACRGGGQGCSELGNN